MIITRKIQRVSGSLLICLETLLLSFSILNDIDVSLPSSYHVSYILNAKGFEMRWMLLSYRLSTSSFYLSVVLHPL